MPHHACEAKLLYTGINEIDRELRLSILQHNHRGSSFIRWLLTYDQSSHLCDGRILEELQEADADPEPPVDFGNHMDGRQRITAQLEEVVMHADLFKLEHVAPDAGHDFF